MFYYLFRTLEITLIICNLNEKICYWNFWAHILIHVMIWYIVGFELVEMAISTIPKPTTVVRNLYENTGPGVQKGAAVHKIICKLAFNLKHFVHDALSLYNQC